eukprot:SAG22_NODE_6_length_41368_cov_49.702222_25_plen_319_part_00
MARRGSSWHVAYVGDATFIVSPVPVPAPVAAGAAGAAALRGWGQLAGDPCSPNGTDNHPPDDLAKTWSELTSASCWQTPCTAPRVFGVDAGSSNFFVRNLTGAAVTIDLVGHQVWCYNQTMHPALVMSVSGNTGRLQDGSILQTLNIFWGGGKATPDLPGSAGSPAHPQSWGDFSMCSNINGRVPKGWTPLFPQASIVVLRAVPPFTAWTLHGVVANASDYPCATEGVTENDIVELADGRLMAVFRTDGGDGHGWQPYSQSFSEDGGTPTVLSSISPPPRARCRVQYSPTHRGSMAFSSCKKLTVFGDSQVGHGHRAR